mgnify:CR=1 FL=1
MNIWVQIGLALSLPSLATGLLTLWRGPRWGLLGLGAMAVWAAAGIAQAIQARGQQVVVREYFDGALPIYGPDGIGAALWAFFVLVPAFVLTLICYGIGVGIFKSRQRGAT